MTSQIRKQTEPPKPAGLDLGVALVPFPQEDAARYSSLSIPLPVHLQPITEGASTTWVEPEEILIADPRGGLTPAQLVDQKLLALLPVGHPGLSRQTTGRPQTLRRTLGEQKSLNSLGEDA